MCVTCRVFKIVMQNSQNLMQAGLAIALALCCMLACVHEPIGGVTGPDPNGGGGTGGTGGTGGGTGGTGGSGGAGGGAITKPCSADTVYYERDIAPLLTSNCAMSGCHGNGSRQDGIDLSSYASVIATGEISRGNAGRSKLFEAITEEDADDVMPPPPRSPLSATQIGLIERWINQGALNNSCQSCDTTAVGFAAAVAPIIRNKCQGCHSGAAPQGGLSLTNHAQIATVANTGLLMQSIEHGQYVTPMPLNSPKLPECEIAQIRKWVQAGALNN